LGVGGCVGECDAKVEVGSAIDAGVVADVGGGDTVQCADGVADGVGGAAAVWKSACAQGGG
jgi:hypothetical protein